MMEHFDFGQCLLHRNFAKGWVIEDRWRNSIVFPTIIPHSGPVERLVHPLGGQGRISYITCGLGRTRLKVN